MPGFLAALWLFGLIAAAPVLRGHHTRLDYGFADRLRDALVLGIAIPFALGLVHLLYPFALWIALAVCVTLALLLRERTWRTDRSIERSEHNVCHTERSERSERSRSAAPLISIAVLALVAWPPLMRPLLDGDTLSYHLPNAAAWAHAHSLWTTDPRYWWYPPASELFASALFTVSGPFALGWCGTLPLLLLAWRIYTWARERYGASSLLADALAAATITAAPLAMQAASLQNDVWLAAFFVEILWTVRAGDIAAAARASAVSALLKPYGWILALMAAFATKAPARVGFAALAALALWIAHDAPLWNHAIVAPASTSTANSWSTSIVAHGLPAIVLLGKVLWAASPFALLALVAAFAGPWLTNRQDRGIGWAACAVAVAFLVMPLAYADWHPQLETGGSLRFAAPAIALGAILLTRLAARANIAASVVLLASTIFGALSTLAIYWNDAPTRSAIGVAILAVAIVIIAIRVRSVIPAAAGALAAIVAASLLAARHPVDYYADALAVNGQPSGIYAWIAKAQPVAVGSWGLRLGTVNVLSPQTRTLDLDDTKPCEEARAAGATLVAVAEQDRDAGFNQTRLFAASSCGTAVYADKSAVATNP